MKANHDFICPKCGGTTLVPSVVTAIGCYGSLYDTERMTIRLCPACFDNLVANLREQISEKDIATEFQL